MYQQISNGFHKRGLPDMNSCITGFIQYKPTNNITNKFKRSKAPPNKKLRSFEELSSDVSSTTA
tara:strand:+ start:401 stop:592 length:192 start_codon:yes stop_codon:yes gene_type:complete